MGRQLIERLKRAAKTIAALGNFIYRWRFRIVTILSVQGIYHASGWLYDNPVWFWAIAYFGPIGNLYMSLIAILINIGLLIFTIWKGSDWLGINVLDYVKEKLISFSKFASKWKAKSALVGTIINIILYLPAKILRLLAFILEKGGDLIAFVALSFWTDAFMCTVYLRHGDFGPLRKKDILIFVSSLIVSCLYWSGRNTFFVGLAKYLWQLFTT